MSNTMLKLANDKGEETQRDLSRPSRVTIVADLARQFKGTMPKERISAYLPLTDVSSLVSSENILLDTVPFREQGKEPVPAVKQATIQQNQFVSLQKWQGVVIELKKDTFLAKLNDLTEKGLEEEAEFPLEEISDDDKELIVPGGVFYWNIGYQISYQGQQTSVVSHN